MTEAFVFRASINIMGGGRVLPLVFQVSSANPDEDKGYLIAKPRDPTGPDEIIKLGDFPSSTEAYDAIEKHPVYVEEMARVKAKYPTLWDKDM